MWRYLVGAGAAALLIVAGMMLQAHRGADPVPLAAMPVATASTVAAGQDAADPAVPEALPATREQKRFNRYDKDRDGSITRDEYLAPRHKAFARLDKDGNGTLSFDEWATKSEAKFAAADADRSGAMNAKEFATTAVKRKPRSKCATDRAPAAPPADAADGTEG